MYEVFAIRYAGATLPLSVCFDGISDPTPHPISYFIWVIRGQGRVIVVDTGFGRDIAAARGRAWNFAPHDGLRYLGVDPARVETVVMTHLHYDHSGNSAAYPNAQFLMQAGEMAFCTGPAMQDAAQAHHYAPENIAEFVGLLHAGRMHLMQDGDEIAPGITGHIITGHTDGQQVLRVQSDAGPVVLASDALHYYASIREGRAFTVNTGPALKLAGYARLRGLAGGSDRIISGHDPEVMRLWPQTAGHPDIRLVSVDPVAPLDSAAPFLSQQGG